MNFDLRHGDCLQVLATLPDACVDSIVTDPPYGLTSKRPGGRSEATRGAVMGGFMGLQWDCDVPSVEIWEQCLRVLKPGGHLLAFAGTRTQHRMAVNIEDAGFEIRDMIAWVYSSGFPKGKSCLKPALEPITMARKRAKRVQPLNIDATRVSISPGGDGRWPANLIHDGSDEVTELFPHCNGKVGMTQHGSGTNTKYGKFARTDQSFVNDGVTDSGSAARFFYSAKASTAERQGVTHPTVKPLDLMAYLCRLITPPNGTILDPFMGSGTTIKAAMSEGFKAIGIERDPDYFAMAQQRLNETQLGFQLL